METGSISTYRMSVAEKDVIEHIITPQSVTIEYNEQGNVTSIIKPSKTISLTYENGEVISFTDNTYLWEIVKTNNIVTGVTVTNI